MDIPSLLDLAKNDSLISIIVIAAAALIRERIKIIPAIMRERRLCEAGRNSQNESTTIPTQNQQPASAKSRKQPNMVLQPLSSLVLIALLIIVVMDSQPVVGARLLLVLALTIEVALSLTLWFVTPLFFTLSEALRDRA